MRAGVQFAILGACSLVLSACITTSGENSPRFALEQSLRADPHAGKLKPSAIRKAVAAEIKALDKAQSGTLNDWSGPQKTSGTVIPGTPFEISGRTCRRYEHRIAIDGLTQSRVATACRNDDGNWVPLS